MAGVLVAPKIQLSPVHLSNAWKSADKIIQGAVALLPNIILAAAVFIVFAIAARIGKWLISRLGKKKRLRQNAATLLGKLLQLAILMIGFLAAMSVVAPSFRLSDLIKILGIGGVAIGFAFKDILQNFLAGILLLIHEPFQIGEQINVTGLEGAVKEIQSRATVITTPDGDHVVIPNATLFTNPVTVRKEKTGVLKPQKPEQGQSRSSAEQGSEKKAESGEAKT
jgi:small conductance mechanosensitive channel